MAQKSWLRFLFDFDLLLRALSFKMEQRFMEKRCADDSIKQFREDEFVSNSIREWIYGVFALVEQQEWFL